MHDCLQPEGELLDTAEIYRETIIKCKNKRRSTIIQNKEYRSRLSKSVDRFILTVILYLSE